MFAGAAGGLYYIFIIIVASLYFLFPLHAFLRITQLQTMAIASALIDLCLDLHLRKRFSIQFNSIKLNSIHFIPDQLHP